ncbi:MAG: beta-lactamase family protein, partial [Bacteroidetes bacterium]|nr:beta-lactamase family protein [Bacteroidota bacterium]
MKIYFYFFFIIFILSSCSEKSTSNDIETKENGLSLKMPAPDTTWAKNARQVADSFYLNFLGNPEFNGHFLLAKNGYVIYSKSVGKANFENNTVLSDTTPIHVASISKVATSLAILRLTAEKKLSIEDPVKKYLANFPFPSIRIKDLLSHRSGLPHYQYFTDKYTDRTKILSNNDILQLIIRNKIQLYFKPNTHFTYCNTNYVILALVVEKLTGMVFPEAMKKLVFNPLGMKHTFIMNDSTNFSKVAQSYSAGKKLQRFNYLDLIYGDKNMYTTARDLLLLDKATYDDRFLPKELEKLMFKGYSYEKQGKRNYGLGIRMFEDPSQPTLFFHTGWWHGNLGMYATLRHDTV